jgi:hypothetical protein
MISTSIGEYVVGAHLKLIRECDFVDYNVSAPGGGLEGLNEMDVLGLDMSQKTAYLCEVATHIRGLDYGGNKDTVKKIKEKHESQREYAGNHLTNFENFEYMFWSPYVPVGYMTDELAKVDGLNLVINEDYSEHLEELGRLAGETTHNTNNPVFRMLQIMEHTRA